MNGKTTRLVRPIPFGGCNLHNPVLQASQDGRLDRRYRDASARRNWLLTLSPRAMIQAHEFLTGAKTIPADLQRLYTGEEGFFEPAPNAPEILEECDVAIIEISTPYEFVYRDLILNVNRLSEFFTEYCQATGTPQRGFEAWRTALLKQQHDKAAELGAALEESLVEPEWDGIHLADLIGGIRCIELGVDETTDLVAQLRDRIGKPVGMVIHNFRFMPDGRAISWPTSFKRDSVEVAQRLGLPTLDLAPRVVEHGATLVVAEDGRHWNPGTGMALVGSWLAEFAESVAGGSASNPKIGGTASTTAAAIQKAATSARVPEYRFDHASGGYFPLREDIMPMVIVLGDAWALGENGDPEERAVTDRPQHPEHALMFGAGAAPGEKLTGGLKALHEKRIARRTETPCSGLADVIMSDCVARFGAKPRMLFSAVGHPGAKLVSAPGGQGFARGSEVHTSLLNIVSSAKHLAAAEGRDLQVLALCFAQARNDEPPEGMSRAYWNAILKLREQYEADLCAITGQRDRIPLLLAQHNRGAARLAKFPSTAAAQLAAADTDPLVRCIGPSYQFEAERTDDAKPWRLSADSYRRLGRLFGRFIMDDILGPGRQPLRAISCRFAGPRTIHLNYACDIALDPVSVDVSELGPGLGIDFVDGVKPSARILSMQIPADRPKRLQIELDSEPSGTSPSLYVAARSSGNGGVGRISGARCAVRAAAPVEQDPVSGTPIYDWACTEVVPVS
jgi:hypothetical protein